MPAPIRTLEDVRVPTVAEVLAGAADPATRLASAHRREPAEGVRIIIREASGPPIPFSLVVVDGVRLSRSEFLATDVRPEDIVAIAILKGPEAVRAYGPAAGEAVLVVRTRRR